MRYFILIILSASLFSCSSLKKSTSKKTSSVEVSNNAVIINEVELTELSDTTTTLPGDTTEADFSATDTSEQVVETPALLIKTKVKNGKIKTKVIQKPRTVPFKFNRKVKEKSTAAVNEKLKHNTTDFNREKEKTGWQLPWYIWLILAVVVGVLLCRIKVKYF